MRTGPVSVLDRELDDVLTLAEALARALTRAEVADAVFRHLLPHAGAVAGAILVRAADADALELVAAVGYDPASADALRHLPLDASTPAGTGQAQGATTVVPLTLGGVVTGALVLGFAEPRTFAPGEHALLSAVATQCAVALQRADAVARDRVTRERLELALQAANMGTWDWDLRANRVSWSPQLEAVHGFAPGAFGTSLDAYFAHIYPDDRDRVRREIGGALESGALRLEYRAIWPNGELHWYEARGQIARDSAGQPAALRGVCMDVTARKQAENALRESEQHFRTLANNISPLAWMANADGSAYWFNQRWYDYTGTTPDQVTGWAWTRVHHPDHVDTIVQRLSDAYKTGEPWEDTFPLRGRAGEYRWFLSRAVPIRDEGGSVLRWLGTSTDITERRWTEALVRGERNALESMARGAASSDVLAELCRTVEQLADDGLIASILLMDDDGVHLRHGAAPSLPDEYNRVIDGVAIGPRVGSCGTAAYRGERVVVADIATDPLWADFRELARAHGLGACWSTPVRGNDGHLLGTFALYYHEPRAPTPEHLRLAELVGRTAAVIIERRRADETRARLVAIVDASDDEIISKTVDGVVTSWNPGAERLYGYTADERIGRPITDIIPADQLAEQAAIMARLRRGERVPAWETARLHKDGTRVDISLSLSPIADETGTVRAISAIGRDAREQRRLEAERDMLLAAERQARQLAEASGRRLGLQYELAQALATAELESTPPLLPAVCDALGWDWGALWRVDPVVGRLRCVEFCQSRPGTLEAFETASRQATFAPGEGLLGRVWQSGQPLWTCNLADEPGFLRADAARVDGLRTGVLLPLYVGREVVGVLSFHTRELRQQDPDVLATLVGIGGQLGQFLERRRAEETLRRQSLLLELAPVAIAVRDAQRRIVYWNPAAEALYGWRADEARGQVSHELLHTRFPGSIDEHEEILEREGMWDGELVRLRRDGQHVTVVSRWLVLRNEHGVVQTLEVSTDITDRKQAEAERLRLLESEKAARAEAEAAIQARDDFVAIVAHDLRNPLAAIKANIQMLRRRVARGEVPTAEQLVERLDRIQSSIGALSNQIDELHDATRLHAGQPLELRLEQTDLVDVARECVLRHQQISERHSVRLDADVPELIGCWDAARLERVLANLLSNAIKYSPDGGDVVVDVRRESEYAVLAVSDSGLGIPEPDLAHVFERFRRASNVGGLIAGSGLGLAGARDIVEQHGGSISVQSEEGHGSIFTVRLPLKSCLDATMRTPL